MDWDEIRFFHAVAEAGSLSEAARRLDVSQPTVGRRIRILEDRLDVALFRRLPGGFELTEPGRRIFDKAEEMASAARCITDRMSDTLSRPEGRVSLTTSEGLGELWFVPKLGALASRFPEIEVDLCVSNERLDISRGAADVALRMGDPHDDGLVGRRIGAVRFHLYASRSYLERRGTPRGPDELGAHSIVDAGGVIRDVPQAVRLRELAPSARVATTLDSLKGQASAVQAGMGLAALPPYSVRGQGDLVRVLPDFFAVAVPVWLLTRGEMRRCVRVAALKAFLTEEARADRDGWRLPTPASDLDCACSIASVAAPAEGRA